MHDFDWDDVRHFLEVVRCGSATRAAEVLGVNQSTVSRRVSHIEERLDTRLFERSNSQRWVLTAAGDCMVEAAEEMAERAEAILRLVLRNNNEVTGRLRMTIGDCAIMDLVQPGIDAFCREYPRVELEIVASNEAINLSAREADIAIRLTEEPPADLVGKRIAKLQYQVYGTAEHLHDYKLGDRTLPCITWLSDSRTKPPWIAKNFPTARIYRVNSPTVALSMARGGMGVVQISCAMADVCPDLRRIPVSHVEDGWHLWVNRS